MSKLYLMTDLEGVAGVYDWEPRGDESTVAFEQHMRQRRWLAQEVSAAVDGFITAGVQDVIVNDGHGAGYTIDLDHMDPRARVVNGLDRPFWLPYLDETCTATGIVGAHAKAQTFGGCLYHTMWLGCRGYWLNGISVGEMGLQAAIAGHYNVPFVFCSGDAYACREIEELIPGCVTVAVKTGLSRKSALTVTPARAQEMIREGAQEAIGRIADIKPFKFDGPILFREERIEPEFDTANPPPRSQVIDSHTREVEATDIIDLVQFLYGYPRDWQPFSA